MTTFAIIFFITFGTFLIILLPTIMTDWKNYKNYKPTYQALVSGEFVLIYNSPSIKYYKRPGESVLTNSQEILLFKELDGSNGSIKLLTDDVNDLSYIHCSFMYIDFYSLYWYKKITKQMKLMGNHVHEEEILPITRKKVIRTFKFLH